MIVRLGAAVGSAAITFAFSVGLRAKSVLYALFSICEEIGVHGAGPGRSARIRMAQASTLGVVLAVLLGPAACRAAPTACPTSAIRVTPAVNLNAVVSRAVAGASFCLQAGEYRMQSIAPKNNQKFYGQGTAVLNGSRLITSFTREGAFWVANNQTQRGLQHGGENCLPGRPRCDHPEAFYIDNRPLYAVDSKAKVASGKFFFDYAAEKIYFLDNPTGKKVEASVSSYAFMGGASGVLVDGITVEKYSSPIQHGAIGDDTLGQSWVVQNNTIRLNYGVGVKIGSRSKLLANLIYNNGEMGIGCSGDDILIEGNQIAKNGYFSGLDPNWEGGGGKCSQTARLTFRNNHSHHNNAYGFWTDIDNIDSLYESNRIEFNRNGGISHEISYRAIIRNNTVKGNGFGFPAWLWGPGILVQNSRDVEVYGNTVDQNGGFNGISLIQQNRGSGAYGPHVTQNNYIHNNRITTGSATNPGASGAIADYAATTMKSGNNRFDHNTYVVRSAAQHSWAWVDNFYDWATYRRTSGQDAHSAIILAP
jgi:hypothetical protein